MFNVATLIRLNEMFLTTWVYYESLELMHKGHQ